MPAESRRVETRRHPDAARAASIARREDDDLASAALGAKDARAQRKPRGAVEPCGFHHSGEVGNPQASLPASAAVGASHR